MKKKTPRPDGLSTKGTKARRPQRFLVTFVIFVTFVIGAWSVRRMWTASSPADGPDHPDLHRHAARRSPPRVRLHEGPDAEHRRARGGGHGVRARLCARAADAAGAREHPVGAVAVRARRPRQRRVHGQGGTVVRPARAAGARLADRRLRLRVRAAGRDRPQPGVRPLRQRAAAGVRRAFDRTGAARRRAHAGRGGEVAERARAEEAVLPVLPHLRAAQALHAAAALRVVRAVRRRGRVRGRDRRPAARSPARAGPLRPRRPSCCSRTTAKGSAITASRSTGCFSTTRRSSVPLIVKLPGQARARRVAAPVQQIDLVPTILDLAGAPKRTELHGRSLRPLLDGTGHAAGYGHLFGGALLALSLRMERAVRAHRRALPADPRAARRAVRSRARSRTSRPRSPASGRRCGRRCAPRSKRSIAHAPIGAPSAVTDEDRQRLAALGYVGGGANASLTLPGDSLADPKDKVARAREVPACHRSRGRSCASPKRPRSIARCWPTIRK